MRSHLRSCERCAEILKRIRSDNRLLAELVDANDRSPSRVGVDIEGYEFIEELHRGGQGVVYKATQLATRRTVAVKMLLQGTFATSRQRRRFEREVELVAGLRHPHIVTVHDSGVTADGRHYFVMEFVEGLVLDQGCAQYFETTDVRGKLELFANICDAVNHAHQRGIIHRDLKPANILVDPQAAPHVLDFGLARPLEPDVILTRATQEGGFMGTFAYAAPEQLQADPHIVDTRSDVYALGVILYEMLTGQHPFALTGSFTEVLREITEQDPPPPSRLAPQINDEVQTITLKAMTKDPQRRYQSAGALLEDVRLYLEGRAIQAKRDNTWYLIGKTARRYKKTVAVAAGFLILLVAFSVVVWVQYRRTLRAEQARLAEARKVTETLQSFVAVLGSFNQEDAQARITVTSINDVLDRAEGIIDNELTGYPKIESALRNSLGLAYLSQSEFDAANEQLQAALAIRKQLYTEPHEELAESYHNIGKYYWKMGRYDLAQDPYRRALDLRITLLGRGHRDVADTLQHLGSTLQHLGQFEEAEQRFHQALAIRREQFGESHQSIANNLNALGTLNRDQGKFKEGAQYFRHALEMIRELAGEGDWRIARAEHNLATCLIHLDQMEETEQLLQSSLQLKKRLHGHDHPSVAQSLQLLSKLRLMQADYDAAERLCRQAIAIQQTKFPDGHEDLDKSSQLLREILSASTQTD